MPDDLALAAEAIVRALAEAQPIWVADGAGARRVCRCCGLTVPHPPMEHCLQSRAVRWVAARDATPPAAARPSLARALNMARPHPEAVPE